MEGMMPIVLIIPVLLLVAGVAALYVGTLILGRARPPREELPQGIPPGATIAAGVCVSLIVGLLVGWEAKSLAWEFFELDGPASWYLFAGAMVAATGLFFLDGANKVVPIGMKGVPLLFGKRIDLVLDEGVHFVIPLIGDYETVDTREQPGRDYDVTDQALSKDEIEMTGRFFWTYQIVDPFIYLSMRHPLWTLDGIGAAATKNSFAQGTMDELLQPDVKSQISARIQGELKTASVRYGVKTVRAVLTKLLPPQVIIDANSQKGVEEAQKAAERIEISNVIERLKELTSAPLNYDKNKAYEILAAERGKIATTRTIHKYELPDGLTEDVKEILQHVFPRS